MPIINSRDIKLNPAKKGKPLINCFLIQHNTRNDRIGDDYGIADSGTRSTIAHIAKLEAAGLEVKVMKCTPPWDEKAKNKLPHGVEITGKEQIARYLKLGGKIFRPNKIEDITARNATFRTGVEGTILDINTASKEEFGKLKEAMKSMGVPFQTAENMIRVDDPVAIYILVLSGAKFNGSERYKEVTGTLVSEFWIQGGNDILAQTEGRHTISVVRIGDADDTRDGGDDSDKPPTPPGGARRRDIEPRKAPAPRNRTDTTRSQGTPTR